MNKETAPIITFNNTDLCSRSLARVDRELAKRYLKESGSVRFDLSNVESMSHCYADELFAVLLDECEWSDIPKIFITGANGFVNKAIGEAIDLRL